METPLSRVHYIFRFSIYHNARIPQNTVAGRGKSLQPRINRVKKLVYPNIATKVFSKIISIFICIHIMSVVITTQF